ncbi:hypothetical protein EUTSA_v10005634mg [Eutrema salsugineum]|uniref:Uncharacterized protein n=1 Tax=Eutrema salsugineum TaxID=72664 RepID=V4MK83_EUTSA|nr:hypothetical protein EUTSA_v10005634mg [Eutrema salsugineum]
MNPSQSKLPSKSIKVVPGRSKLRVESSNPVARGNPLPKSSKVKLITPEEAMQLSSGVNLMPVSPISIPPRHMPARATSGSPRPTPFSQTHEAPRPTPPRQTHEEPRPVPTRLTSEAPRPVSAHPALSFTREFVCGLRPLSMNPTPVRQRSNPRSVSQSRTVEPPPSPRALQETCQPTSDERLSELLLYRPALHPTWKGRIVDSAILSEFDCEFWAKPASKICGKALRLSKEMPTLLKVELLPTGHILDDLFHRSPRLSNVELYLFPDEKNTERFKGEHVHLFEAMVTRNAMIKVNIKGSELLMFSSKVLDETSQFFISTQNKTENYLWGFFLQNKISQAPVPGTSYQTNKDFDEGDVVDMELDTDYPTPSLALKLVAESQRTPSISLGKENKEVSLPPGIENPSRSPGKVKKELSLPPGFEKIWTPPLVTLNIHGTWNHLSEDLTGSAGLVRDESGKWVFGYVRCHKSISQVTAGLLAIYHGLKPLWDSGCRRIRLETTSREIIDALTTNSGLFLKRKSILRLCKEMILKDWECEIYHISKEQNSCAEWLASRLEGQPQGLVFFEYPPRGLLGLLEKDRLAAR